MGLISRAKRALIGAPMAFAADETPPRPIADVLLAMSGAGLLPRVNRALALSVAPVQRARDIICSVATLPLIQYDADWNRERLPLLEQIDPAVANVVTLAQTVEDLLFDGLSWWEITRWDAAGYPIYAQHLDISSVTIDPPPGRTVAPLPSGYDPREAVIYFDGRPIPASRVIRFDSPNKPLLSTAGRSIKRAVLLDTTSALYAENPRPLDYFSPTDGADPVDDDAIAQLLTNWARWRQIRTTGYVPASVKYNTVDVLSPADLQLTELLKQAYLNIANATGLDPEDLGISTTSRTYQNGVDRRQDRINNTTAPFMAAITQRLSMPDITKRGKRVEFDLDDYLKADPATRWGTYKIGKEIGVLTADEIRREERMPPLTIAQSLELAPPAPAEPASVAVQAGDDEHLHLSFDVPEATFAVDAERRVLEGVVVPYGPNAIAIKNGFRWRFQQGSLVLVDPADRSRNKLLRDHDNSQPQGPMQMHEDRPEGMFARYKVGRGPDGDRTLAEAEDQVRDGFSVGVDIHAWSDDPLNQGVRLVSVGGATWYETSVLAVPAFAGARITRVAATRDNGDPMKKCATCGVDLVEGVTHTCEPENHTPALQLTNDQLQALLGNQAIVQAMAGIKPPAADKPKDGQATAEFGLSAEQVTAILAVPGGREALLGQFGPAPEQRPTVDPTRGRAVVKEESPYRFDRKGNLTAGQHDFSSDVIAGLRDRDEEALTRAQSFVREQFATAMTDVAALNPNENRPGLYVDQREFEYPIWNTISKGTIQDATPFVLPKFNTSSGLVAAHVENTEPTPGVFTATSQTITPSAVSGKVEISREAWDQGGNPQLSGLIWRQMIRAWFEALEASSVALLEAAAPTTITIVTASADAALEASLTSQLAPLQYIRGGFRMRDFFIQVDLYKALIAAKDSNGRKLFPVLGAQNATGTTNDFFSAVMVAGLVGRPAWALAATSANSANSYLFDSGDVSGWATAPMRLTFDNIAVAKIHVGIWGYKALAITDITGVRRLAYDPV
jgi:hypothetical protein